jgi:hypothetical protein
MNLEKLRKKERKRERERQRFEERHETNGEERITVQPPQTRGCCLYMCMYVYRRPGERHRSDRSRGLGWVVAGRL